MALQVRNTVTHWVSGLGASTGCVRVGHRSTGRGRPAPREFRHGHRGHMSPLTPSRVDRAGRRVRQHLRGEDVGPEALADAISVISAFRVAHRAPLDFVTSALGAAVRDEGVDGEVSRRLKRELTIVDKLTREPALALSRMQDIGGCRAVLPTIETVRSVQLRLTTRSDSACHVQAISDYIDHPRASGYRAVHIVLLQDGRRIEVQLRTRMMHFWALMVEVLSARVGQDLKGVWHEAVSPFLVAASEVLALEEAGRPVPDALVRQLHRHRLDLRRNFEGRRP